MADFNLLARLDFVSFFEGEEFVGEQVDTWTLAILGNHGQADPGRKALSSRQHDQDFAAIRSKRVGSQ